jgi:hypothetical protein
MREQVTNGDGAPRRNRRTVGDRSDGRARECRDEFRHRIRQQQPPLLDQHHDADTGQRLGLGRDAEDGVTLHRSALLDIAIARGFVVDDPAVAHHHRDRARDLLRLGILVHDGGEPSEPFGRHAHPLGCRRRQSLRAKRPDVNEQQQH